MRLNTGMQIPDFEFFSQYDEKKKISDVYKKNDNTLLLFLRYYGCTLCQLDLKKYMEEYDTFKSNGTEVIIVLQSNPKNRSRIW